MLPVLDGRCWQGQVERKGTKRVIVELWPSDAGPEWYGFAMCDGIRMTSLGRGIIGSEVPKTIRNLLDKDFWADYDSVLWNELSVEKLLLPGMISKEACS